MNISLMQGAGNNKDNIVYHVTISERMKGNSSFYFLNKEASSN